MIKKYKILLLTGLMMLLSGCIYFGSHNLPPDKIRYNKSAVSSELQQTLLNLVRLKYNDMPNFLSLNNIVSQYSVNLSIAGDASRSYDPILGVTNILSLTPSSSISENPTITYTPLQGEEFVQRLLTKVDIKVIALALREGWSVARVFRTFIQRLGSMENALVASRPGSHRVPVFKDFTRFTKIMRKIQNHSAYTIHFDETIKPYKLEFHILNFKILREDEIRFLQKFVGVSPAHPKFSIVTDKSLKKSPGVLVAQTRTMLGIYSFLSKGVEIPEQHGEIGNQVKLQNGQYFDWKQVVGGLIDVKFCQSIPERAYIYVYYRGYYFYIDDEDHNSKEGMSLLMIINGIFQGNIQSVLPVFTVS